MMDDNPKQYFREQDVPKLMEGALEGLLRDRPPNSSTYLAEYFRNPTEYLPDTVTTGRLEDQQYLVNGGVRTALRGLVSALLEHRPPAPASYCNLAADAVRRTTPRLGDPRSAATSTPLNTSSPIGVSSAQVKRAQDGLGDIRPGRVTQLDGYEPTLPLRETLNGLPPADGYIHCPRCRRITSDHMHTHFQQEHIELLQADPPLYTGDGEWYFSQLPMDNPTASSILEVAEDFAHSLLKQKPPPLLRVMEDIMVVNVYTMETPVYRVVNAGLRQNDRSVITQWADYMVRLGRVLDKLPPYRGISYRGLARPVPPDMYTVGSLITWQAFSSSATAARAAREFLKGGTEQGEGSTLFIINALSPRSIREFSCLPEEDEVLFNINTQFRVTSRVSGGTLQLMSEAMQMDLSDVTVYDLQEVKLDTCTNVLAALTDDERRALPGVTRVLQHGGGSPFTTVGSPAQLTLPVVAVVASFVWVVTVSQDTLKPCLASYFRVPTANVDLTVTPDGLKAVIRDPQFNQQWPNAPRVHPEWRRLGCRDVKEATLTAVDDPTVQQSLLELGVRVADHYPKVVPILLEAGAQPHQALLQLLQSLPEGCDEIGFTLVKELLAAGADLHLQGERGRTALHWACRRGFPKVVGLLVDKGSDPEHCDGSGLTGVQLACEGYNGDVLDVLLQSGKVAPNAGLPLDGGSRELRMPILGIDAAGKTTFLMRFVTGGVQNTIPTIGFNVNTCNLDGYAMTMWDVGGQDKIRTLWSNYLPSSDAIVYMVDSNDRQRLDEAREALHWVAKDPHVADVPIIIFASKRDLDNVLSVEEITQGLLLDRLAQSCTVMPLSTVEDWNSALHGLRWLLRQIRFRRQTPLLEWAAQAGDETLVSRLLELGADVHKKSGSDSTPLVVAAREGHVAVVDLLIAAGANVQDALVVAVQSGHTVIVERLLAKGADATMKAPGGGSLAAFAVRKGFNEIAALLKAGGADENGDVDDNNSESSSEEVSRMLQLMDQNGDGFVDMAEYSAMCGEDGSDDEDEARLAYLGACASAESDPNLGVPVASVESLRSSIVGDTKPMRMPGVHFNCGVWAPLRNVRSAIATAFGINTTDVFLRNRITCQVVIAPWISKERREAVEKDFIPGTSVEQMPDVSSDMQKVGIWSLTDGKYDWWWRTSGHEEKNSVESPRKSVDLKVLLIGLDGAGKTTALYRAMGHTTVEPQPTVGFNVETLPCEDCSVAVWDIGGASRVRPLWRHYYTDNDWCLFMVDATSSSRFDEARVAFHEAWGEVQGQSKMAVLTTRSTCEGAATVDDVRDGLRVPKEIPIVPVVGNLGLILALEELLAPV